MAAITNGSCFGAQKNEVWHCFHCFPIHFLWSDGTRCHDLSFLNVEPLSQLFHSPLSLSSRGSLVLLCFLPRRKGGVICISNVIDISPSNLDSSLCFIQPRVSHDVLWDDNIQPWCTPFPIWNQSVVSCPVLTVASWPAYRFLGRQIRWSGIPIS